MIRTLFVYLLGCIILLLFIVSVFGFQRYIDFTGDFWKMLKNVSVLMLVWYGVAGFLFSILASDTNKTETRHYSFSNGRSFALTRETGEIIPGDEELGKSVFKIWWFLFPICFVYWSKIKLIFKYQFTEHPNLNIIIRIASIVFAFILFCYTVFRLDQEPIPRVVIRVFMYGILGLFGVLLIMAIVKWSLK